MIFFEFVEKGVKFCCQSEIVGYTESENVIGCDAMGYIHKPNQIKLRVKILVFERKFMKIQYLMYQKI